MEDGNKKSQVSGDCFLMLFTSKSAILIDVVGSKQCPREIFKLNAVRYYVCVLFEYLQTASQPRGLGLTTILAVASALCVCVIKKSHPKMGMIEKVSK